MLMAGPPEQCGALTEYGATATDGATTMDGATLPRTTDLPGTASPWFPKPAVRKDVSADAGTGGG